MMKEIDLTTAIGATIVVFFLILFISGIYIFFDGYTMTEICASNEVRFSNMFCQTQRGEGEMIENMDNILLVLFLPFIFCFSYLLGKSLRKNKPNEAKRR